MYHGTKRPTSTSVTGRPRSSDIESHNNQHEFESSSNNDANYRQRYQSHHQKPHHKNVHYDRYFECSFHQNQQTSNEIEEIEDNKPTTGDNENTRNGKRVPDSGMIIFDEMSSASSVSQTPAKVKRTNQVLAAFAVSFGPFAVGLGKGYTSPALASMMEESSSLSNSSSSYFLSNSNLNVTEQQGSWIAALSLLGALFGGLCSGLVLKFGRKRTLSYVALPFGASWLLTAFASRVEMVQVTAFLVGFFSAIIQIVTQVYISEIAHPSIRASLCSASKVLNHVGLLSSFALGAWLDWRRLALVCGVAPLALFFTARFVPETPSFLLYNERENKAEQALIWLRGSDSSDVSAEMATIHSNIKRMKDQGLACKDVLVPQLLRPLLVTSGLMFFNRFSGVAAFQFYAVTIFKESFVTPSFNPHLAAVVVGCVQLAASAVSGLLSDSIGRLPLLTASTALMTLALSGFGAYSFVYGDVEGQYHDPALDWIPLLCVVVFVAAFSLGLNPISWLLIGEVFPLEYRNIGSSAATAFSYICAFVSVKTFVDLQAKLGMHGTFWTYAVISAFGLIYSFLFVPETKGKTLDEMEPKISNFNTEEKTVKEDQEFGGETKKNVVRKKKKLVSKV